VSTILDKTFGRVINQDFINDLPENVDVCGENEFHTFTFDGPYFLKTNSFRNRRSRIQKNRERDASDTACDTTDAFDFGFWWIVIYHQFLKVTIIIAHFLVCKCHNKFCSYTHFRLNFDGAMKRLTFDSS
jgi:hypothetical protein